MKRSRIRPRNPERRAKAFVAAYGSAERVDWVKTQPCVVCNHRGCENAHIRNRGAGLKGHPSWIVPLCHTHHAEWHQRGRQTFEKTYNIDLTLWAAIVDARWEAYRATQEAACRAE